MIIKSKLILFGMIFTLSLLESQRLLSMEEKTPFLQCYQEQNEISLQPILSNEETLTPEYNFILGCKCFKEENYHESIRFFKKAADHNYATAEYNLGVVYEFGVSAENPRDFEKAEYWYQRAQAHGDSDSEKALKRVKSKKSNWFSFLM